ncbi:MAG: hypothetical protein ACRCUQ_04235 [Alphaproteobacteria bacterium]
MNKRLQPISVDFFKSQIVPLIEASKKKSGRPSKIDLYSFFCGILYVLRTGISGEIYRYVLATGTRFKRWSENGFFWNLLYQLQSKQKICMEVVFVDGSIVPHHRHGGGALKKGGATSCWKRP